MGYYINKEMPALGKANAIAGLYGGAIINRPNSFSDIPQGKALIVVIDNGPFEAAGFAYSEREFQAFTEIGDSRPKTFVTLDWGKAVELTGFE